MTAVLLSLPTSPILNKKLQNNPALHSSGKVAEAIRVILLFDTPAAIWMTRLDVGAEKSPGEKQYILDDFEIAPKGLEEAEPIRLGDVGLAPVEHSLRASKVFIDCSCCVKASNLQAMKRSGRHNKNNYCTSAKKNKQRAIKHLELRIVSVLHKVAEWRPK